MDDTSCQPICRNIVVLMHWLSIWVTIQARRIPAFKHHCTLSLSLSLSAAGDFGLDVDITTAGDTLLQLTLAPIPGTVRLRIKYISQENPDSTEQHMRISNGAFTNVSRITVDVPNSDVPYQRFKVQVALMVGSQQGPFVPESLDSAITYGEFSCVCIVKFKIYNWGEPERAPH